MTAEEQEIATTVRDWGDDRVGTPEGFAQMMNGLVTSRIQVASRALGVAATAFDGALANAQQRASFGRPSPTW